jgi:ribonuclease HI
MNDQIHEALNKRCENTIKNPTKMINSILNRHKSPVKFDNIKTNDNLITEPNSIKEIIRDHFCNWTALRPVDYTIFESSWSTEYDPKSNIQPSWYSNITQTITIEEVQQTIYQLPNNKACGPSGISYEMFKYGGLTLLQHTTELLNQCLIRQQIPKQWKNGHIFPISKKLVFDGDLSSTRPISLIEHIKKLYTKILTNRLNNILTKYNILSPFNYIALPGNSTNIPINILNNIIEDASCNQKELWLLSQDMSKAYDSVNFDLFKLSLQRIQFPTPLINILTNLLFDRNNKVITNFGLTQSYQVQNGIDQGETITPLFWRIYYDPLISKISSSIKGYQMTTTWSENIRQNKLNKLQASTSVLAYMDDTLWIAKSKQQLSEIITIATSFFLMANIQVNPQKSVLISNTEDLNSIQFINSTITPISSKTPFKFLGCWFTLNNNQKAQIELITKEAFSLSDILNTKNITDKQASYIINKVIIPTLEYRLQNIILSRTLCDKILSKYLTVAKHKASHSRSLPNSTMLNTNIYGIKNIWDIQLQHHISNFLARLNNSNLLGTSTQIRIQQLQNNLWSTTNILQHPNPQVEGPNKHTTTFKIIKLFNYLGITIIANNNYQWPKTYQHSAYPLEKILSQHTLYRTFKKQLRQKNLLYLDQLMTSENNVLLKWQHISPRIYHLPKGKQPLWFSVLEETIIENQNNRTIKNSISLTSPNPFPLSTGHYKSKTKPWIIATPNYQIILGKARRFFADNNSISITHWQTNYDSNSTAYYPTPFINCTPCPGCSLNSKRITNKCTIDVSATHSTKVWVRPNSNSSDNKLKLNANYIDLIYSLAIRHPLKIPSLPTINLENKFQIDIFKPSEASKNLLNILSQNYNQQNFIFYTDGSVQNISTNQCSMGIGWVQIYGDQIIHSYSAQIQTWPSSYKAELVSILSALCTIPKNSNVQIFTDSQSVISKYNKILHLPHIPKKLSNLWPIWQTLLNLIKSQNIQITFTKVQAHSDSEFNNQADLLAKQHTLLPYLEFNYTNLLNNFHTLKWNNFFVEQPTRKFVKNICNAHILALWSSQHRVQLWKPYLNQINWDATWALLNNNTQRSSNYTNYKLSKTKTFRIKNLLNNLPTLSHLHLFYPNIIKTNQCISCSQTDNSTHWLFCSNTQTVFDIIKSIIKSNLTIDNLDIQSSQLQYLHNLIINHHSLQFPLPFSNDISLHQTIIGLVPKELIQILYPYTESHKSAYQLIVSILIKLSESIYEQIWKPYCTKLSEWKQANNINLKKKNPLTTTRKKKNKSKHDHNNLQTINCICGYPENMHINSLCPPEGLAQHKIDIWSIEWVKYSIPTNNIINIQI